jgi:DNA-binding ferritin-like protein
MATNLDELAAQFRAMQLFAHIGHNRVSGPSFFEDHEFLGGLYEIYEGIYDSLAERMIGLGESPDLWEVTDSANGKVQEMQAGTSSLDILSQLLAAEKTACSEIEGLIKGSGFSQATVNLLAQIADDSEQRQYKIQQRVGKLKLSESPGDALDRLAAAKQREKNV